MMTKEEAVTILHLIDCSKLESISVIQIKLLEHACRVLEDTLINKNQERSKDESI